MAEHETSSTDQLYSVAEAARQLQVSEKTLRRLIRDGDLMADRNARGHLRLSLAATKAALDRHPAAQPSQQNPLSGIHRLLTRDTKSNWDWILIGILGGVGVIVIGTILALATQVPGRIWDAWTDWRESEPVKITDHPGEPFTAVSFLFDPDFIDQGEEVNRVQMIVCAPTPYYYIDVYQISPPLQLIAQVRDLPDGCDSSNPVLGLEDGEVVEIRIGAGENEETAKPILVVYQIERVDDDIRLVLIDGTPTTRGRS